MSRGASRGVSRTVRVARWLWGNAAYALLVCSVAVLVGAIALATRHAPAQAAGDPQAASTTPQWITLHSQAPGDIIAAVRQSHLFTLNRSGNGDELHDVSRVGTPQLVTELRVPGQSQGADCYDVPILNRAGQTVGIAVAWLNPAHTAVYVGYIRAFDTPQATWLGALPAASQAASAVQAQQHTAARAGTRPQLVYFPFDFQGRWAGTVHWSAGGEGPDTPVWLIPGADGQDHIVGTDGRAYLVSQLPLAPQG